jgi:phosphoenolpyruvate carboxykinase (GTP)
LHSEGLNRPEDLPNARVFMDRSWLTTFSMFCTYAGNTLLLKKGNHRMAVDQACYYGGGKELSEHMFVTGMKDEAGEITWIVGAAPSGCGKTTTAMAGTEFIGDDREPRGRPQSHALSARSGHRGDLVQRASR